VLVILLSIVIGLILLLGLLLAIPVDLVFTVRRTERVRASLRFRGLLGAVQGGILPRRKKPAAAKREEKAVPEKETRPRRRKRGRTRWPRYALAVSRADGLITRGLRLVRDLVLGLRIRELILDIRFGLDDPADTGQLYGSLCPVLIPIESLTASRVHVEPEFDGPALNGVFSGALRLVPLRVVGSLLVFVCSPPALRAGWAVLRERFR
jgi:hypothetical protein